MSQSEPDIKSPYALGNANEPIVLSEEDMALVVCGRGDGHCLYSRGTARVRWLPSPTIEIAGTFPGAAGLRVDGTNLPVCIPGRKVKADGYVSSLKPTCGSQNAEAELEWRMKPPGLTVRGDKATELKTVVFHVVNFVDYRSRQVIPEEGEGGFRNVYHLMLECDRCRFHMQSVPTTSTVVTELRSKGGFAVTHIGELRAKDEKTFTARDAEKALEALSHFLSFARGSWCGAALPVGFDAAGDRVWERWSLPWLDSYRPACGWFDKDYGEQLEGAFPGFMKEWDREEQLEEVSSGCRTEGDREQRPRALQEAIYWYLLSNNSTRGIDAGLILTQAALERLYYLYFAESPREQKPQGSECRIAAGRHRALFGALHLPLDIPPELERMTALAEEVRRERGCDPGKKKKKKPDPATCGDAADVLTVMRNDRVHPDPKKRRGIEAAIGQAWNLGLWYVEMVVLRLCKYEGQCANRLESCKIEQVPPGEGGSVPQ